MKKVMIHPLWIMLVVSFFACQGSPPAQAGEAAAVEPAPATASSTTVSGNTIVLPQPRIKGTISVEEALAQRRSVRSFTDEPVTLEEVSQLLWAAQGITEPTKGLRTAPSAGATYPLETYIIVNQGSGIDPGAYHYIPQGHKLERIAPPSGVEQHPLPDAATIVFTAVFERTSQKYGERAALFVHLEAGHAAQNVCLQAVALGLATVVNGIFDEKELMNVLNLPPSEKPLYIVRIGHQRK